MCRSVNLSWKITVQNAGFVFAYFSRGHKYNFQLQFWSSFNLGINRGSRSQMFFKIDVLKNFAIFTGRRFQHSCFPVNIAKFLKTAFFIEHLRWLLLSLINAKRYRNDLNWLCSTVFAVKFEHILQCLPSFSIHCSLWACKRRLRSEYVCFLPAKKSYLSKNKN